MYAQFMTPIYYGSVKLDYADCKVVFTELNSSNNFTNAAKDISVKQLSKEKIAVTNNSDQYIEQAKLFAFYYKDGKQTLVQIWYASELEPKDTMEIEIQLDQSDLISVVDYDEVKVAVNTAYIK